RLHHGEFMWRSRNAATHDGNPIINIWADGRYYVSKDIQRFETNKKASPRLITIPAPTVDVAQFCLEFAQDFCYFLVNRLESALPVEGVKMSWAQIEPLLYLSSVPEFAKKLLIEKQTEIATAFFEMSMPSPTQDAIPLLRTIAMFCEAR